MLVCKLIIHAIIVVQLIKNKTEQLAIVEPKVSANRPNLTDSCVHTNYL